MLQNRKNFKPQHSASSEKSHAWFHVPNCSPNACTQTSVYSAAPKGEKPSQPHSRVEYVLHTCLVIPSWPGWNAWCLQLEEGKAYFWLTVYRGVSLQLIGFQGPEKHGRGELLTARQAGTRVWRDWGRAKAFLASDPPLLTRSHLLTPSQL